MNNPHLKARVLLKLPTTPFRDNFRVADDTPGMRRARTAILGRRPYYYLMFSQTSSLSPDPENHALTSVQVDIRPI